ncbi:hypothetical protein DPMN_013267 [Dreissena polymorpha]|uniref:Uncharacterized protein n=1 Tax=Dreissena polymorpha TaxID=45954 RepID=A0A9D4S2A7_DREPO|nr:hypothetical protein DPMN_013267 [Dreissena polymorpha]
MNMEAYSAIRRPSRISPLGEVEQHFIEQSPADQWYRNHTDVVERLSFVNHLGQKWKEGDITKCSGGRRISIGCCGCLKKYHVAVRWSKRYVSNAVFLSMLL